MDVVARDPFRAASAAWMTAAGEWRLTVVCKLTFTLVPDVARVSEAPLAVAEHDVYLGGDPARSLHTACDLVPSKALTDVVLVGRACAPGGATVRALTVRLAVGDVDKRLDVHCDRVFWQGRVLNGQPFSSFPLAYELAAGGPGTANPAGVSFDAPPDSHGSVRIPNLQPPATSVNAPGDRFPTAGFGPIAPHWPERAAKLGRLAGVFEPTRWREGVVPRDLNDAFFNCAPRDRQIRALRGDERLLLENLTPEAPALVTRLPGLAPHAVCAGRPSARDEALEWTASTLHLDSERGLGTLTWLARLSLRDRHEPGQILISERSRPRLSHASEPPAPPASAAAPSARLPATGDDAGTVIAPHDAGRAAPLPFEHPLAEDGRTVTASGPGSLSLPFVAPESPWVRSVVVSQPAVVLADPEDTGTLAGPVRSRAPTLPFEHLAARALAPPESPDRQLSPAPLVVVIPAEPAAPESPPPSVPASLSPPQEPPPEPAEQGLPVELYPAHRCGKITASVARTRAERDRILASHDLDPGAWSQLEGHWAAAIEAELLDGATALLDAFDDGYAAQLDAERGVVSEREYARLLLASERGRLAATLDEMGLPPGAMMRLERVWGRRIGDDDALDDAVERELEALRTGARHPS